MQLPLPQSVVEVTRLFTEKGYEIYIVGGAVRDILMGKLATDWDFTTNATPDEMLSFLPSTAFYTNQFGTVGLPSDSEKPFEITTFRTEHGGYTDNRRPDEVRWGKTLGEDLQRRDFTINAMAIRIDTGNEKRETRQTNKSSISHLASRIDETQAEIIDLYEGQMDLENKIIRTVGNPDERFGEDALRMMRAIRIASELHFTIEENTFMAIQTNAQLITKISRERVRDELFKILASPQPVHGIELLRDSGLLALIIPELDKTFGVEQKSPGRHHIYDVGTHLLNSLKAVCERNDDVITRFATLIHDIGKPQTYRKLDTGTITFYNHELVGGAIAKRIADRLKFSNEQKEKLWRLVRFHQFTVNEQQTDSALRRFITNVGVENLKDIIDLRIGDRIGSGSRETSWRTEEFKRRLVEVQKQPFTVKDLKVDGNDVMQILGIPPGKRVGEILTDLFTQVVEQQVPNEREILVEKIHEQK